MTRAVTKDASRARGRAISHRRIEPVRAGTERKSALKTFMAALVRKIPIPNVRRRDESSGAPATRSTSVFSIAIPSRNRRANVIGMERRGWTFQRAKRPNAA